MPPSGEAVPAVPEGSIAATRRLHGRLPCDAEPRHQHQLLFDGLGQRATDRRSDEFRVRFTYGWHTLIEGMKRLGHERGAGHRRRH